MDPVSREVEAIMGACWLEKERIEYKTRAILIRKGIFLEDPKDITRAVEVVLTDEWQKDNIDVRLSHFRGLRRNLGSQRCPIWRDILSELRQLGNDNVPNE